MLDKLSLYVEPLESEPAGSLFLLLETPLNPIVERVETLILPVLEDLEMELVDIEYQREGRGWVLRIYLDKEGGITLDDCAVASREISTLLDVEDVVDTAYNLEVSSPGLDRPLKKLEHFERFKGEDAKIKTLVSCDPDNRGHKRKTFSGTLQGVQDGKIVLLQTDKKGGEVFFGLNEIEKANLVFEF